MYVCMYVTGRCILYICIFKYICICIYVHTEVYIHTHLHIQIRLGGASVEAERLTGHDLRLHCLVALFWSLREGRGLRTVLANLQKYE